ncbi:MAG: hypothetical protein ACLFTB_05040 [Desulfovibrionales bacterium]
MSEKDQKKVRHDTAEDINRETGRHKGVRQDIDLIEDPRAAAFSPQMRQGRKSPSGTDKVLEEIELEKELEEKEKASENE